MKYLVISNRNIQPSPAQNCINEFEDVMETALQAQLYAPFQYQDVPEAILPSTNEPVTLFLVCIYSLQSVQWLKQIRHWRKRFDKVALYIFDAYEAFEPRPAWRDRISSFHRTINQIDHIFIGLRGGIDSYTNRFKPPVTFVPLAADVLQFGSCSGSRCITVNGYGRQQASRELALSQSFNTAGSGRLFYHTSHTEFGRIRDYRAHRRLFWQLLASSQILLAEDPLVANKPAGKTPFPFSFVGQRWFEGLAAGCVIVGSRPSCSEASHLLDWEDATITPPADEAEFIPFLDTLLADHQRMQSIRLRNHMEALSRHDWRHRLHTMLDILEHSLPESLLTGLAQLEIRKSGLRG